MFVEPPATIAVLGAGPIGLEAALYARYLGYDVKLLERGRVAENVRRWGHVRMFSPYRMNASPLGLAALAAQDASFAAPLDDALLTGAEWVEQYLWPLAQSDLIADALCENTRVIAVARSGCSKGDLIGDGRRASSPFRVLVEDGSGGRDELADVVIDTTGTFGNHNWFGPGGAAAIGEMNLADKIEYGLPDILGEARSQFAGRSTLVIGSGYSAATNIVALVELLGEAASGEITWITNGRMIDGADDPIARIADDRLAARDALAVKANALSGEGSVNHLPGAVVEGVEHHGTSNTFSVNISRDSAVVQQTFDNIIANVGYRPDASLYEELQVHQCYATNGPMNLAAALLGPSSAGSASADCLDQTGHGPSTLLNPEPSFYILGGKSYGRNSNFLVSLGLEQIRDVFTIIGGREDLDLYSTMQPSQ